MPWLCIICSDHAAVKPLTTRSFCWSRMTVVKWSCCKSKIKFWDEISDVYKITIWRKMFATEKYSSRYNFEDPSLTKIWNIWFKTPFAKESITHFLHRERGSRELFRPRRRRRRCVSSWLSITGRGTEKTKRNNLFQTSTANYEREYKKKTQNCIKCIAGLFWCVSFVFCAPTISAWEVWERKEIFHINEIDTELEVGFWTVQYVVQIEFILKSYDLCY